MNCEKARGLIGRYVDGELSVVYVEELESHIAGCPSCASGLKELEKLGELLAFVPGESPPSRLAFDIIEVAKFSRSAGERRASPLQVLARIAAALLIIASGLYFGVSFKVAKPSVVGTSEKIVLAETVLSDPGAFKLVPPESPGALCLALYNGQSK